jgi:hypothetical protein
MVTSSPWTPLDVANTQAGSYQVLWTDAATGATGMYIKVPAGNPAFWHFYRSDYHGVLVAGSLDHHESGRDARDLAVGTYWWQPGGFKHVDLCKAGGPDCLIYAYFTGPFQVVAAR